MATRAVLPILVGMMLLTGVCNTLLTKYQDKQCVANCSAEDPNERRYFEQPVWQTGQMFVGEAGCWLVIGGSALYSRFFAWRSRAGYRPVASDPAASGSNGVDRWEEASSVATDESAPYEEEPTAKPLEPNGDGATPLHGWRVILLSLPASCDIAGTTLMNVGLLFVAASIYQMTRGALVLFVGLFSVMFLRRHLGIWKWIGLFIVVAGVAIVGLAGVIEKDTSDPHLPGPDDPPNDPLDPPAFHGSLLFARNIVASAEADSAAVQIVIGILFIFCAQIFTASQFVIEEAIMHRYTIAPLSVVAWEGIFGLILTLVIMFIMHMAYGRTPSGQGGYFDARTGWHQMTTIASLGVTSLFVMISIGGFNYFGLTVTRTVSATSRSTIDTCRTLFIWIVSLGLRWETFKWLQVLGFAGLVYGTFLFNNIVKPPKCFGLRLRRRTRNEEPLPEGPIAGN